MDASRGSFDMGPPGCGRLGGAVRCIFDSETAFFWL